MKLKFNTLNTSLDTIRISFDGGKTYKAYNVEDIKKDMFISFTEEDCPDISTDTTLAMNSFSNVSCPIIISRAQESKFKELWPDISYYPVGNMYKWLRIQ